MAPKEYAANELLTSLLRDVSRSFYLTLRVLPRPVRRQIGIAYLLARATDTIADTNLIALSVRLETLQRLRARIMGQKNPALDLGKLADKQGTLGERALLKRLEEALHLLESLSDSDRGLVQEVLQTITSGQELDLQRFAQASSTNIVALKVDEELDDYTYRVAGCVGEFWTKMCLAHLRFPAGLNQAALIENGIQFGKGLQLVNILRDISADILQGRCYVPESVLAEARLLPAELAIPSKIDRFRPIHDQYLDRAHTFLDAGWMYTNTLPFSWIKVRLACAWPILIGARTIHALRQSNPLDGARRVKVTRGQVKKIMASTVIACPFPPLWRNLYPRAKR